MALAVEMQVITKKFGNFTANDKVNLQLKWAEIHGICGENGAGKTTLMNTLYGLHQPTAGEIYIDGKRVVIHSPKDSIALGIGMVQQHFSLVPSMTVAENIVMGKPPHAKNGLIDKRKSIEIVEEISRKYNLTVNPSALVKELPVGLQQRVEILKALYLGANILIMDEPTAVLTPQEINQLFITLDELRNQGKSIILITHKLSEVTAITDRITVMRLGKTVGTIDTKETTEHEIARMMVGREVLMSVEKDISEPKEIVLDVNHISCSNDQGISVVNDVSFCVRQGEIVGIAGVQGNGQTELIEAITGLRKIRSGKISIGGNILGGNNTSRQCRDLHVGHIPEDRQEVGAARYASIRDNYLLYLHTLRRFHKGIFLNYKEFDKACIEGLAEYDVRYNKIQDNASSLSGGNLQKLIIAREMYTKPHLLVAAQPTRGVDIGATEFIHKQIVAQRDLGSGVLLFSNELSEIISLSDRILVMYRGQIIGEVDQVHATEEKLGLWMAGIKDER